MIGAQRRPALLRRTRPCSTRQRSIHTVSVLVPLVQDQHCGISLVPHRASRCGPSVCIDRTSCRSTGQRWTLPCTKAAVRNCSASATRGRGRVGSTLAHSPGGSLTLCGGRGKERRGHERSAQERFYHTTRADDRNAGRSTATDRYHRRCWRDWLLQGILHHHDRAYGSPWGAYLWRGYLLLRPLQGPACRCTMPSDAA